MSTPPPSRRRPRRRFEIETRDELVRLVQEGADLGPMVVQGVDLRGLGHLDGARLRGAIFIDCRFDDRAQAHALEARGASVFPEITGVPFRPWRHRLYTPDELMAGFDEGGLAATCDFRLYTWFDRGRRHPDGPTLRDGLAQRIHDHAIEDALAELLADTPSRGVAGIMGGHGLARTDPAYAEVVRLGHGLARAGFLVATGGGPGAMEAGNLGAWLAAHDDGDRAVERALAILADAPRFDGGEAPGTDAWLAAIDRYVRTARAVRHRLAPPPGREPPVNLAVPTWFYGHEPTNLFATHVAKYFANGIREDGLLTIADAGVIYAPGSAGTWQEVFMDLAQNHYATSGWRSPMVFLGRERWRPVVDLLLAFAAERHAPWADLVGLVDTAEEALAFVLDHPARRVPPPPPPYPPEDAAGP